MRLPTTSRRIVVDTNVARSASEASILFRMRVGAYWRP